MSLNLDPTTQPQLADTIQRFYFDTAPVRGDLVQLSQSGLLKEVLSQKDYPHAIRELLSELLAAAALLVSGIKFEGRLSIQLQGSGALNWAMAECSDTGVMRALAQWDLDHDWKLVNSSSDAMAQLDPAPNTDSASPSVIFLNMEPETGERYQSIVERTSNDLSKTLSHYLKQSLQIDSALHVAIGSGSAAALLLQKLPGSAQSDTEVDADLWNRAQVLAKTLKDEELLELEPTEVLTRLYHEETVRLAEPQALEFGCTCSKSRMESALLQLSEAQLDELFSGDDVIEGTLPVECRFCGQTRMIERSDLKRH